MRKSRLIPTIAPLILGLSIAALPGYRAEESPEPGRTTLQGSEVVIPMNLGAGRPMIRMSVNGKGPYDFIVDTGASISVLDDGIARELGLEEVGTQTLHSPGQQQEIKGRQVVANMQVSGLRIEGAVVATMELMAFSGGMLQGVLGRPHFRELLLTFDYPGSRLIVSRDELDAEDPSTIRMTTREGSIRFPLDVAGRSVPMVLDTGSPGGITLPKRMESELEFRSAPRTGPTIQLVGGAHESWKADLLGTVRLADIPYEDPSVVLTTFAEEFGNVGIALLRELEVSVDQANQLLRFRRKEVEAPAPVARRGGVQRRMAPGDGPRLGVGFKMSPAGFLKDQGGLQVNHVESGGDADRAGIRPGDILLSVNGTAVAGLDTVNEIGSLLRGPRPMRMSLLRDGGSVEIVVE